MISTNSGRSGTADRSRQKLRRQRDDWQIGRAHV